MAKIAIKNENNTSFGGIYYIMGVFSKLGFERQGGQGADAEIRCTLKRDSEFADTHYTIHYFQSDGKGLLRNDNSMVFNPNDRYHLTKII